MSECDVLRESMPQLLTESLDRSRRELSHQHIESCPSCGDEWAAYRQTWSVLGELPEVTPPARLRARFLDEVRAMRGTEQQAVVVPLHRRPAFRWLAQAAAVVVVVGGAYFAGGRTAPVRIARTPATLTSVQPAAYSIAESRVLPASAISPDIQGRPAIGNVQFIDADASDDRIGLSFDVTSRVTVNGSPSDKSMVRLLSYVLENDRAADPSRSRAIEWVRQTYSAQQYADPEIAAALAKVLRSDDHEGVRIRAVDTLKTLPATGSSSTREALVEALKNDPNPGVRIKAVEALANLARAGNAFDTDAIDTLRQKASQDDENLYVRAKAAEVLSSIQPH